MYKLQHCTGTTTSLLVPAYRARMHTVFDIYVEYMARDRTREHARTRARAVAMADDGGAGVALEQ